MGDRAAIGLGGCRGFVPGALQAWAESFKLSWQGSLGWEGSLPDVRLRVFIGYRFS